VLLSLTIKDLVLIDTLHLTFEQGLSVLTGETGAGKSILLDALGLALGMRGDISLIRQGAEQAIVCAEFSIEGNAQIATLLDDHGMEATDTLFFRRIVSRGGRSRAFINDQMISIGLLRLFGDALLEIHGQFDRLLDPASYRLLLDEFAQNQEIREMVRHAYRTWQQSYHHWEQEQKNLAHLIHNEDFIRHQLAELKKLNPAAGEEEALLSERANVAHIAKLSEAIRDAARHLQEPSVEAVLYSAMKSLQRIQSNEKAAAALAALERACGEVIEANAQIQDIADQLANSSHRLQEIDDRLYALRAAARKHGVPVDGLASLQETLTHQLDSLEHAADLAAQYEQQMKTDRATYLQAATQLRAHRIESAQILEQAVMRELPALKLPQARFIASITELPETQWSESGLDHIDFMVAMNKGQDVSSLSRSASGGELARLMLALKVGLASRSAIPTLIFDEIDIGVGGAVATAIGERLAALANQIQVLAITHSPQLAACAHAHFLVFKEDQGAVMRTSVEALSAEKRQDEVARMLSGAEVTQEARAAALRLLTRIVE
jgi:DNA repair protein RecN (Recombination protein N)